MKNTTMTPQDLGERIERIVREYISDSQIAAQAAMERAFASHAQAHPRRGRSQSPTPSRSGRKRRSSAQVEALAERFYQAVCEHPGETMAVLSGLVGSTARELHRSVTVLKNAGRLRSVGSRSATRYFPMLDQAAAE